MKKKFLRSAVIALFGTGLLASSALALPFNNSGSGIGSGDWDADVVRISVYSGNEKEFDMGVYSFTDPTKSYLFNTLDGTGAPVDFNIANLGNPYGKRNHGFDFFRPSFGYWITFSGTGESYDWLLAINFHNKNGFPPMKGNHPGDVPPIDDIKPIPEPATMLLFGMGLASFAGLARRKKK
jgi:hypothetical protein